MSLRTAELPGYLGWREASAYTGLSETTLRRLVREKKIRAFRPSPNRTLLAREDLDAYIRGQQVIVEEE